MCRMWAYARRMWMSYRVVRILEDKVLPTLK